LAADAVYDEKGTLRRIQGAGEIIEAWQGRAKAFPDSKATFVREFASGETAVFEIAWKGTHTGPLQTPTGIIPASNKPIEMPACQVVQVEGGKVPRPSCSRTAGRCAPTHGTARCYSALPDAAAATSVRSTTMTSRARRLRK
jgi:hypothetical protein